MRRYDFLNTQIVIMFFPKVSSSITILVKLFTNFSHNILYATKLLLYSSIVNIICILLKTSNGVQPKPLNDEREVLNNQ